MSTLTLTSPCLEDQLEHHRGELTGYCRRVLGSRFEAEDAVQETLLRAWRSLDCFEGRGALRSWLYRIATNVSTDMLNHRSRRAVPVDLSSGGSAAGFDLHAFTESRHGPVATSIVGRDDDPAQAALAREAVRFAFLVAMRRLTGRQRAILVLRDVLRWTAPEVAELLDSSVASVNSALQRARASLDAGGAPGIAAEAMLDSEDRSLLSRYLDAFEAQDMESLVALLKDDARA
jgi:RNA polymerase sigma-70 factor (ECF subfamily)